MTHRMGTGVMVWIGVVVFALFMFGCKIGGVNSESGDDDDDAPAAGCPDEAGQTYPVPVPGFAARSDACFAMGLLINVTSVAVSSPYTDMRITGDYTLDSYDQVYLRGEDRSEEDTCYVALSRDAFDPTFAARASFFECRESAFFDVVASPTPDAPALCTLLVETGLDCADATGDDDTTDDDASDDDTDDDSDDDADDDSDDDIDDDTGDDDTMDTPYIWNGVWNPDEITSYYDPISVYEFLVCSQMSLLGGQLYFYVAGSISPFLAGDVYWDDFNDVPSGPISCSAPYNAAIAVDFTGAPNGTYCTDLEVTDGYGNLSNLMEDVCVTMSAYD